MSIFYCHPCGSHIDSDFIECETDPKNDCELICIDCYVDMYVCGECDKESEALIPHPFERTDSFKVCPSCSDTIINSYEFSAKIEGLRNERL